MTYNEETTPRLRATVSHNSILMPLEAVRRFEGLGARLYHNDEFEGGRWFMSLGKGIRLQISNGLSGSRLDLSGPAPCEAWNVALLMLPGSLHSTSDGESYSDTFRQAWEQVEGHARAEDIRTTLVGFEDETDELLENEDGTRCNADMAVALYWIGVDWHGGASCPLYPLSYCLGYSPGMCESGPEEDSSALDLYNEIDAILSA